MEEEKERKRYLHIEFDERGIYWGKACMDRDDALVLIAGVMLEFDLPLHEVERAYRAEKVMRRETKDP